MPTAGDGLYHGDVLTSLGPFTLANLAASETATDIPAGVAGPGITVPRACTLLGLSVSLSAAMTTAPATFTVQKNAVDTTLTVLPTTAETEASTLLAVGSGIAVAADDVLTVVYDSGATLDPETIDANCQVWIAA